MRRGGDEGLVLSLRLWCSDSATAKQVQRELAERISRELPAKGVEVSVPAELLQQS